MRNDEMTTQELNDKIEEGKLLVQKDLFILK